MGINKLPRVLQINSIPGMICWETLKAVTWKVIHSFGVATDRNAMKSSICAHYFVYSRKTCFIILK